MWTLRGIRIAVFVVLLVALVHADKGGSGTYGNSKSKGKGKGGSDAYYAPQPHKVIIIPAGPSQQYGWVGFGGQSKKDKDKKIPRLPYVPFPAVIQKGNKYGSIIHHGDHYGGNYAQSYSAPVPQVYNYAPSYPAPSAYPAAPAPAYHAPPPPAYHAAPAPAYHAAPAPAYQAAPVYSAPAPVYSQPIQPAYEPQPAISYANQPAKPAEEVSGGGVTVPPVSENDYGYESEPAIEHVPVYIPESVKPSGPASYEQQANAEYGGQTGGEYAQPAYGEQGTQYAEQPQYVEQSQYVEQPQYVEQTQYVEQPQYAEQPQYLDPVEPRPFPEAPVAGWADDNGYQGAPEYRDAPVQPEYAAPATTPGYVEAPVGAPVYEQAPISYPSGQYEQQHEGGWVGEAQPPQWLQSTVWGSEQFDNAGEWSQQAPQVAYAPQEASSQVAQAQEYNAPEQAYRAIDAAQPAETPAEIKAEPTSTGVY